MKVELDLIISPASVEFRNVNSEQTAQKTIQRLARRVVQYVDDGCLSSLRSRRRHGNPLS